MDNRNWECFSLRIDIFFPFYLWVDRASELTNERAWGVQTIKKSGEGVKKRKESYFCPPPPLPLPCPRFLFFALARSFVTFACFCK